MAADRTSAIAVAALAGLALAGCASRSADAGFEWRAVADFHHIPMPALETFEVEPISEPPTLANFGHAGASAERARSRDEAVGRGAIEGALNTGEALAASPALLFCLYPPLCLGLVAAGGVLGGTVTSASLPTLADEDDRRMAAIVRQVATSEALAGAVSTSVLPSGSRAPGDGQGGTVRVHLDGVALVAGRGGHGFVVRARTEGSPRSGNAWKPALHFVRTPLRDAAEWLGADGAVLRRDLKKALDALAQSVASVYAAPAAEPEPGKPSATLVLYRPDKKLTFGWPEVFLNGEKKFELASNTYATLELPPGEHEIKVAGGTWRHNWSPAPAMRRISVLPGRRYYVAVEPEFLPNARPRGIAELKAMSRTRIVQVGKAQAEREIASAKPVHGTVTAPPAVTQERGPGGGSNITFESEGKDGICSSYAACGNRVPWDQGR